jgi:DNA modification methylase
VGSGTTLVEASMLGRSSVGVDIDPLSVAITRAKLDLLTCKPEELSRAIAQMGEPSGGHYEMPRVMARKFERKGTEAEKESYEVEIAGWRAALERVESVRLKRVLSMALSDAILRKFNVRMMGTGVGRFALEIRRRSLSGMVRKNLEQLVTRARLCQDLLRDYDLKPAPARVLRGDATALELPDASVHGILTSPPYLPASSGREAYLVGKSLSLTALGLMTEAEIAQAERGSLGSMKAALEGESANLPPEVYELVDWLANDPLRAIKAEPTLAYYREIKAALTESHRVLRPGHRAIFVVGRESVFYTFKTRKVLRRVPCDALFEDIARSVGFEVVDRVDVELDKRNPNARPRSRDPFYETAVMLER